MTRRLGSVCVVGARQQYDIVLLWGAREGDKHEQGCRRGSWPG